MGLRYFKRNWEELRVDESGYWGTSIWYFEVGDDDYAIRQIEVYENGKMLKYDESNFQDNFGGLADQPLELEDFVGMDINKEEFEVIWNSNNTDKSAF